MKAWYTSKTLWTNFVALLASAALAAGLDLGLTAETQVALVGGILAVANMVLRMVTKTEIG